MKKAAGDMYHWIYPEPIDVPAGARKFLEQLYPTVDWDTVTFHTGMPWVFRPGSQIGVTLPGTCGLGRIHIYFKEGVWDPCTCSGLAVIAHEGFHVVQYRDCIGGWGIGYARPFIIAYLSCALSGEGVGRDNTIEKPAYAQANNDAGSMFDACCAAVYPGGKKTGDCSTHSPAFDPADIDDLLNHCPGIVRRTSGFYFWEILRNSVPGRRWLTGHANDWVTWGCGVTRRSPAPAMTFPGAEERSGLRDGFFTTSGRRFVYCPGALLGAIILRMIAGGWLAIWFFLMTVLSLIITVVKTIAELLLLIADGMAWLATGIVCAVEWLGGR